MKAIKQFSPKKKLQLNELIWRSGKTIPIEHQNLVAERIKNVKENPALMVDWEEASKAL